MTADRARIATALASAALLVAASVLVFQLIAGLRTLQHLQTDAAELRDVRYGLLNAEVWVDRISEVLARRIDDFEVTEANRPRVKRGIEQVLDRLFVEIETYMRRRNAAGDNWLERFQGQLRQGVQDLLIDFTELRARVPAYADAVIDELNRPATRAEIKTQLLAAIDEAAAATFSRTDTADFDRILAERGCADAARCLQRLAAEAAELERRSTMQGLWIAALVLMLLALSAPRRRGLPPEQMGMLTAATLVLLAAGVLTPMIEVEARITELRFELLGAPITFTDQVLYFQSKSILDVVRVLADTGAADMIVVAVLITLFSLVFPAAKVIAGFLYYFDTRGLRAHRLVYFFALRSGKWSMADVLVVAILMAYIGFSGLVSSQLSTMARASENVEVMTTNGTALQIGFFMFLGFVLASLVLSSLLEARVHDRAS